MATLAPQSVPLAGLSPTYAAASAGGDAAVTGSGLVLHVKNGDAASHTVTLVTPGTEHGLAIADRAVTVAASGSQFIPLSDDYKDPSTGLASITYDAVTSVTVAVLRVP
ncbi:hypothetical protein AAW14_06535 [Streptomyces hygroscopicus]|uniref:hypothetical protein n=1 Tax=Streptomyces hygroscopicus TaxID=1912 RepID=UPI002240CD7A|nr:hypothetical protein [Streptomyces hygroscopicus]MCW7941694.1 hypothetical protein [Streptomyces hygroscopicus]